MIGNVIEGLGRGLKIQIELGTTEYGTPRPLVRVRAPKRASNRHLAAALHIVAALVEVGTPPHERWGTYVERRADDSGLVYLELFDGSDAEATCGMEVLRAAIERLGWT